MNKLEPLLGSTQLVNSFYEGLTFEQRQFVEALSNGRFLSKTLEKAWAYFDELAANNQTWEMTGTTEPTRAMGKYVLHDVGHDDVRERLGKLTHQLEMLTTKKVHEVSTKKPNPPNQHGVGSSNEGHMEHLKVVTTLCSGREVDKTIYLKATNAIGLRVAPTPSHGEKLSVSAENLEEEINVKKDKSVKNEKVEGKAHEGAGVRNNGEGKSADKESVETPTPAYHPSAPFPQRLRAPKKPNHNAKIYKLFETLKVKRYGILDGANPDAQIPVILGWPFLATSDTIIQCRNGRVKFSFGNMMCDLKIFDLAHQVGDEGNIHELVCLRWITLLSPEVEHAYSLINMEEVQEIQDWMPRFEKLPPITKKGITIKRLTAKTRVKALAIHTEIRLFRGR
ncbi:hypothetical protein Acr_02g0009980 [Actinidia rufa]|uniref:Uncharacterized protein n=1 Tax=Actinidia rufa TaxID=165716 RepID=A0A7J0E8H5_9ERIC|nr:hypothetical protein Acr_02g0009980 [Actinidia rufa]